MFWKTYVVVLISWSSFQKTSDIILGYSDDVFVYISGMSLIISVDSILIFFFPTESPSSIKVIGFSAKFLTSVDRWRDVNVDRRSSRMSILLLEAIVYTTSCIIELICNPLLMCWDVVLLHEEIICSICHLKNICNVLSGYLQCMSIYCFCIAIWIAENTKLILC